LERGGLAFLFITDIQRKLIWGWKLSSSRYEKHPAGSDKPVRLPKKTYWKARDMS
jgi:hypothetical protein